MTYYIPSFPQLVQVAVCVVLIVIICKIVVWFGSKL